MASAKFEGGKLHSSQEVKAQFRHSEKEERMKHEHSNKQIDLSLTVNNYSMENLSYQEMCDRYDNRIKELEPTTTNKRKDRVTCQCIEIPVPKDLPEEREEEWFRDTWSLLKDFYGEKNAIDGKVHADEKQPYMDNEGNWQIPRTHMHTYFVPEVNDSLNGKEFSKRTNIRKVNKMIHEMTMDKYGVMFMDGTKNKSTKTVEELKNDSRYRESVDILISQYEDMQAEKADLQADYDAKEAELIAEAYTRKQKQDAREARIDKYERDIDEWAENEENRIETLERSEMAQIATKRSGVEKCATGAINLINEQIINLDLSQDFMDELTRPRKNRDGKPIPSMYDYITQQVKNKRKAQIQETAKKSLSEIDRFMYDSEQKQTENTFSL